jgi:hypothetical protein
LLGVSASRTPSKAAVDRRLKRVERHVPRHPAKAVRWARKDLAAWARIPLGIALVAGGLLGFLPILGYWMVPVGLILLAKDIPFLRTPAIRFIDWGERKWRQWKTSRR